MQVSSEIHEWWETLRAQMGNGKKDAGFLFVYAPDEHRLSPKFPKEAGFGDIPSKAIIECYQAAEKGHLAALRPDGLSPCIVATDPQSALVEVPADVRCQSRKLVTAILNGARQLMQQGQREQAEEMAALRRIAGSASDAAGERELSRSIFSAREAVRLVDMIAHMPVSQRLQGEIDDLVWQISILAAQAEAICVQRMKDEESEEERQKAHARERQFQAALILSRREQEEWKEDELSFLLSLGKELAEWEPPDDEPTAEEQKKARAFLEVLNRKETLGDQEKTHRVIENIIMGKDTDAYHTQPAEAGGKMKASSVPTGDETDVENGDAYGTMLGSALRQFVRYAASEVPLSMKHAEVGRQCRIFMKMAEDAQLSWKELGLSQQEYMAVQGTIELGKVVRQGLEAKSELIGEKQLTSRQKFVALRDYLSMKALEQALAPHVAAHQDMIETGDGPLSSIQLLMGNTGFSARDIHRMVSRSEAMAELLATPSGRLSALMKEEGKMAVLGRRAMAACYDSDQRQKRSTGEKSCAKEEINCNRSRVEVTKR